MKKIDFFILSFVFILLISTLSYAHLEGEAIKTKDYRFEFAFANAPNINSDNAIIIKIENSEGTALSNSSVWVRISKDDKLLFSSSNFLTDDSGAIIMAYKFSEYGNYDLDVSLNKDSNKETANYKFQIKQQETTIWEYFILAVIFVIVFVLMKNVMLKYLRKN